MNTSWKDSGFDKYGSRKSTDVIQADFIGGAKFDSQLDELMFNRIIQFKNITKQPQGNNPGKVYYDPSTKKAWMWVGGAAKWVELVYTSTSTTTTSSSSSSSSTSTTSSSTTTTSSSSSSTSTTTT